MDRFSRIVRTTAIAGSLLILACTQPGPAAPQVQATPRPDKLTFVHTDALDGLDSQVTSQGSALSVLLHVQEGLTQRDPKTMEMVPALAVSWTYTDPNAWVFKLRPGVRFHNGESFDAETVRFNFARVVALPVGALGTTLKAILDKVEVVDSATVRISTKDPAPFLLERLARMRMMPPKETAAKDDAYVSSHPVGTGPYRFGEWAVGQRVVLERNDDYWGPKPAYRSLVFRQIAEQGTAIAELLAGTVDIVEAIGPDSISSVERSGVASVQSVQTGAVYEVRLDALGRSGPDPFQDKRVRQAANLAVDREAIAKNLLGGFSRPVNTFVNPLWFGYDPSIKPYPFDPVKAKQLLVEAGYPNGFDTDLTFVTALAGPLDGKVLGEAIASDLGKVGIRVRIRQVASAEFGTLVNSGKVGAVHMLRTEAGGAFDMALAMSALTMGATGAYYANDQLEQLRLRAQSAVDLNERKRLYSDIQKLMSEEVHTISGWTGFTLSAVRKTVDWAPSPDLLARLTLAKPK